MNKFSQQTLKTLTLFSLGVCALLFTACGDPLASIEGMVSISGEDFAIGKYEVTQKEYKNVMGNNPSKTKGDDRPVECVSWHDAMEYCEVLTAQERKNGKLPKGYKYTLPTSKQWEIACRAKSKTRFCSGDSERDLQKVAWYSENSGEKIHIVGTKEPNAWGIYDMHGNVAEWCADKLSKEEVTTALKKIPLKQAKKIVSEECNEIFDDDVDFKMQWQMFIGMMEALDEDDFRENMGTLYAVRGGAYDDDAFACESSSVDPVGPKEKESTCGFRVALVPEK